MYAGDGVMRFGPDGIVPRHDFATVDHLANLVNPADLAAWVLAGDIFPVDSRGVVFYPIYAFTAPPLTPLPVMREILAALNLFGWEAAEWFCCGCPALDWRCPQNLLLKDPGAVLSAAGA